MKYTNLLEENRKLIEINNKLLKENNELKRLLEKYKIVYENNEKYHIEKHIEQKIGEVCKSSSTEKKLNLYKSLFRGRYDVFAIRFENKNTNKAGYAPCCLNQWKPGICNKKKVKCSECLNRNLKALSDEDLIMHFKGLKTIGMYPLLKGDLCNFFAIDFDDERWKEDIIAVYKSFKNFGIVSAIEISRSGSGAHLWIFFNNSISATKARYLGNLIMQYTIDSNIGMSLDSFDRFFPNQDKMPKGNFGNLIALPLQRVPMEKGFSMFVDEDFRVYDDQWIFLSSIEKYDESKLDQVIECLGNVIKLERKETLLRNEIIYEEELKDIIINKPLSNGKVNIILATGVYIEKTNLSRELVNEIKKLAMFSNPEFYRKEALRLYVGKISRTIRCFDENEKYILMPRGCRDSIVNLLRKYKLDFEIKDERINGEKIEVKFKGALYEQQLKARDELIKYDDGILYANTAFGKTVVALNIIATRKVSTLIIVNSIELLEQWESKINIFLNSSDFKIGKIGAGKKIYSNFIDIATIQTLNRMPDAEVVLNTYGQIIVDECHHIAAFTFENVLKKCKARYILGLTATIKRKDGFEAIVEFQCGNIRVTNLHKNSNDNKLAYELVPKTLSLDLIDYKSDKFKINDYYELMSQDKNRNNLIFDDIMNEANSGRNIIILTERIKHLEYMDSVLKKVFDRVIVLRGGMGKKQREDSITKLKSFKEGENFIIISTGKYIGEGFDEVRLDTLFLTMPISWEGRLKQYAGRLHRSYKEKELVKIYDYIDSNVPELLRMYKKRQKGYKAMGYELESNLGFQEAFN